MEPLNSQERTVALFKFLGLFLVTILLVCTALYFDWEMPNKQIQMLKEENARLSQGYNNTRSILVTMDSISNQLNRYASEPNKGFAEAQINQGLINLSKLNFGDSTDFGRIVRLSWQSYQTQLQDKKGLLTSGNCSAQVAQLESQLQQKTDECKKATDEAIQKTLQLKQCLGSN